MGQRIATAVARKNFAGVVKQSADGERIKLTRYNKTLAVLIPKKDLDALEQCESDPAVPDAREARPRRPRRRRHS